MTHTLEERVAATLEEIQRKAADGNHGSWPQIWFDDVPAAADIATMLEFESGGQARMASVQVIVPGVTRVMDGEVYFLGRWIQLQRDGTVIGWPSSFDLENEIPPTSAFLHEWAETMLEEAK